MQNVISSWPGVQLDALAFLANFLCLFHAHILLQKTQQGVRLKEKISQNILKN